MSSTRTWKGNIKFMVIKELGSYFDTFRLAPFLRYPFIMDEDNIDKVTLFKFESIIKILYIVMINIDDKNTGNKTLLLEYIDKISAENIKISQTRNGYFSYSLKDIRDFISKVMIDNISRGFIFPPEQIINIHTALSLAKICSGAWCLIGGFFTSDETSEHRFKIVLSSIMAILSPALTQYSALMRLRDQDFAYELKKNPMSTPIDSLTDECSSLTLRGTISHILQLYTTIENFLANRFGSASMPITCLLIEFLQGEILQLENGEEKKPTHALSESWRIIENLPDGPKEIKRLEGKEELKTELKSTFTVDQKDEPIPSHFLPIIHTLQSLKDYVTHKKEFCKKSPPGLFNQTKIVNNMDTFLSHLNSAIDSRNISTLKTIIGKEMTVARGDQTKFSPEFPQWHGYQSYLNYLSELMVHLIEIEKDAPTLNLSTSRYSGL